jgi:lipoprotein NlpI
MESSQLPQDQSRVLLKSNDPIKFWFYRIDTVLGILVFVITIAAAIVTWFFFAFGGVNWYYSTLFVLMGFFGVYCILPIALSPLALLFWIIDSRYPLRLNFRLGLFNTVFNLIAIAILGLMTWVSFKVGDFLAPAWARAEAREQERHQPAPSPRAAIQAELAPPTPVPSEAPSPTPDEKLASDYCAKAWSEGNDKHYEDAIKDYTDAIRLKSDYVDAYVNRGWAYNQLQQYQNAIVDLAEAIRLKPDESNAFSNRGFAYNNLEQYQKAINDYTEVIRLKPDYADAYNNRGYMYYNLKQYQNAIADCSEALRINPGLSIAYGNRGAAYRAIGNLRAANADFAKAKQLGSGSD